MTFIIWACLRCVQDLKTPLREAVNTNYVRGGWCSAALDTSECGCCWYLAAVRQCGAVYRITLSRNDGGIVRLTQPAPPPE